MRKQTRTIFILLIFSLALMSDGRFNWPASSEASSRSSKRIRFEVAAIEERGAERSLIYATTIEGPPGTDFTIRLHSERFQMSARFLTDLLAADALRMRADLATRRLYGYSERNLPLYEEDAQKETMRLGFEEKLVLLPFGQGDSTDQLKIEITPYVSEQSAYLPNGTPRPLEIRIPKASPNGAISVQASKIPHRYVVEASLLEDGREIARGADDYHLEETGELVLQPDSQAGAEVAGKPLMLSLTIDQYVRNRPADQIAFSFSLYRAAARADEKGEMLIPKAAGMAGLGTELDYDLCQSGVASTERKYQLRLRVKLAPGEDAE
jgi:hypothetical protein